MDIWFVEFLPVRVSTAVNRTTQTDVLSNEKATLTVRSKNTFVREVVVYAGPLGFIRRQMVHRSDEILEICREEECVNFCSCILLVENLYRAHKQPYPCRHCHASDSSALTIVPDEKFPGVLQAVRRRDVKKAQLKLLTEIFIAQRHEDDVENVGDETGEQVVGSGSDVEA